MKPTPKYKIIGCKHAWGNPIPKDTKIMLEFAKYSQSIVPLSMDQIRERKCQE